MNTMMLTEQNKEYWLTELQAPLPVFDIYTDFPKHSAIREVSSETYVLDIDTAKANSFCGAYNMNTWMLASYFAFLFRMTNEKDMIVGVKSQEGKLNPIRVVYKSEDTFKQLYEQITGKLERMNTSDTSLADIEYITGHSNIFQTIYGEDSTDENSRLNWFVTVEHNQWILKISYCTNLFKEQTIQKYVRHFKLIVDSALDNINIAIDSIAILTEEDVDAYSILNNTAREMPAESNIVDMFAAVAKSFPQRTALSTDHRQLTYEQLDRLSNKVAHMLVEKGLRKGQFVSIFMERSIDVIISLMGVLKAGGAYVPLDPEHPDDRNAYIISDTQSHFILTNENFTSKLAAFLDHVSMEKQVFQMDKQLDLYSEEACYIQIEADDLAYVIYTSGSTGRPKGALIAHKGVVNLSMATRTSLNLNEEDIFLQYSTFSFDASVYDIFGSLSSGSRLHLLSNEQRFSVESFTEAVENTKATRIAILPTVFFNQLSAYLSSNDLHKYQHIKSIVVGGEALAGETVRLFQKKMGRNTTIINAYGPTEVTVVTTTHTIDYAVPDQLSTIYIGKPLANYELFIVNESNRLCPLNVIGELLISSVGVAKGYLNQPEKTSEVFICDPIQPNSDKRFYRSGDLVRLLANGQIEYMGRKDAQVKIRGYRIEIGEIEDNLAKHEFIKDVAIIPKADDDGTKMLVAFYTSKDGLLIPRAGIVQFLNKKVPSYMVPKHICFLDSMPLTPSGKIDRKKLAILEVNSAEDPLEYVVPETELQQEVCAAWEKAMKRTKISIHDHFFDIGGHSLKILEILVILKPRFPKLKINDFFLFPTIAQLSARIEELMNETVTKQMGYANEPVRDLYEFPAVFQTGSINKEIFTQLYILLTGSTGYLGSHLLYELLTKSEAMIYCLVRPTDHQDPYERLVNVMSDYFGSSILKLMEHRVYVVQGDLEKEDLGLSQADMTMLIKNIDSIFHCGAEVKHFGDANYFTKVNVDSTQQLLTLAKHRKNVRFHYISTLGIPEELALSGQWETFVNRSGYDYTAHIDNVYTNSKFEAEKLVVKACEEEGVPATVYRVGNLSCHSDNGSFQKNIDNNAFYRMLKAMILLKTAPKVNWQVDITPIDYAGESIAALALSNHTVGRLFHICNPTQLCYEQMIGYFREYGYEITFMDLEDYEAWLLDTQKPKNQAGLELAMAQLEGDGAKSFAYQYSCPQTLQYLADSHVHCEEPKQPFFDKLIDYAVQIGYFNQP
ncbi:non-ribosomal peptide synthetase family protein [Paenibacillus eucommiae]|uniref:Amino acid adenylation domain-containing protein/thioester reductase-like protein n=1 Tax=Paenibacillus eucommiae TaxID=1355755 RepID=A0ABS4J955_9BACL|nr:non-ribosomal peptide synthetase [Paenibacillus eucommiae]MBP1996330.1 amino acid adenylation domain-containing protein/thioester reductase-like protein [Paenibacillus eucommiae]